MPNVDRTENQKTAPAHQTAEHDLYIEGGDVVPVHRATGLRQPAGLSPALLLLDIAQTLASIRNYGVAQQYEYGKVRMPNDLKS